MKKKRSMAVVVVVLLLVLIAGGVVTFTRSRYQSSATGSEEAKVAPWVVKVNGTDIVAKNTFTADSINWATNANVSDGYIAPGRTGTFEIEIDPTGSKVAMEYEVSIDDTALNSYSQISIESVKVGRQVLTKNASGKYAGTISLTEVEANTKVTLTVTIGWTNSEENNTSDTAIGKDATSLSIPVTVTVSQKVS